DGQVRSPGAPPQIIGNGSTPERVRLQGLPEEPRGDGPRSWRRAEGGSDELHAHLGGRWPGPRRETRMTVRLLPYVLVGIGGFIGANARFMMARWVGTLVEGRFPLGTFLINVSGS